MELWFGKVAWKYLVPLGYLRGRGISVVFDGAEVASRNQTKAMDEPFFVDELMFVARPDLWRVSDVVGGNRVSFFNAICLQCMFPISIL